MSYGRLGADVRGGDFRAHLRKVTLFRYAKGLDGIPFGAHIDGNKHDLNENAIDFRESPIPVLGGANCCARHVERKRFAIFGALKQETIRRFVQLQPGGGGRKSKE